MKKICYYALALLAIGCGNTKSTGSKPLYEMITTENDGGANFRFYEILSEPKEIGMLLNDPSLKRKVKKEDILTCSFIILNMGEKPSGGYQIGVENVEETTTNIIVTVKEIIPLLNDNTISVITSPYSLVKINSKKPIIIK